ncbi:MAG: integrin alpha, partial [Proteobacteria bacterium]|nr:integrin alpha [Pseudomonadota bacterium]
MNQHTLINNKYKLCRNRISLALTIALGPSVCQAQFASSLDLSDLNGSNGFVISGENPFDFSGTSSAAGDINGDGVDDLIIGAYRADPNGIIAAGNSYVVYGNSTGLPNPFRLSDLN